MQGLGGDAVYGGAVGDLCGGGAAVEVGAAAGAVQANCTSISLCRDTERVVHFPRLLLRCVILPVSSVQLPIVRGYLTYFILSNTIV